MSWDATIFGNVRMPAAQVEAWLGREIDSAKVPNAEKYLSTLEVNGETVRKTLADIEDFQDEEGLGFIEITRSPTGIEVRSFLAKDEYLDYCVNLAAVWAAAGQAASGELEPLEDGAADELPVYQEILARVEARVAELGLYWECGILPQLDATWSIIGMKCSTSGG